MNTLEEKKGKHQSEAERQRWQIRRVSFSHKQSQVSEVAARDGVDIQSVRGVP